mgnify:CR=1 FL=1
MTLLNSHPSGRHFLQIPGPTNVPDRVLRAIDHPTIDHRGPEFGPMGIEIIEGLKHVFQTQQPVVIYPASGTGAWEAALVNVLSPGDKVLMVEDVVTTGGSVREVIEIVQDLGGIVAGRMTKIRAEQALSLLGTRRIAFDEARARLTQQIATSAAAARLSAALQLFVTGLSGIGGAALGGGLGSDLYLACAPY